MARVKKPPLECNPWHLDGKILDEAPSDYMGFVYLLTSIETGRMYVGKKLFWSAARKMVNGKKKKIKVESDWKVYHSSCAEIQDLVKQNGALGWWRDIIHLAKTKGTLNYLEAREQMDRRVLENPAEYINGIISCKVHWSHVKLA